MVIVVYLNFLFIEPAAAERCTQMSKLEAFIKCMSMVGTNTRHMVSFWSSTKTVNTAMCTLKNCQDNGMKNGCIYDIAAAKVNSKKENWARKNMNY